MIVEQQSDYSRHGDIKIHSGYPIVSTRLEIASELTDLAPAMEIITGITAFFKRDDLGEIATEQRKGPPGSDYPYSHIMLIQHKDITIQTRLILWDTHRLKRCITFFTLRADISLSEYGVNSSH